MSTNCFHKDLKVTTVSNGAILTASDEVSAVGLYWSDGDPNSQVTGNPGSVCLDHVSGNVWRKSSGTGDTGWVIISAGFAAQPGWSVINPITDRTLNDGQNTTLQEVTHVLGSLIEDLKSSGILTA